MGAQPRQLRAAHREQVQKVLTGTARGFLSLQGCQLLQPQVETVEFGQVQAAVRQPVRLRLVQGHQILEVHSQNRQPESCAASPGAAVTGVVVVGRQELCQLQQGLCGRGMEWGRLALFPQLPEGEYPSASGPPGAQWHPGTLPKPLHVPHWLQHYQTALFLGSPSQKGPTISHSPGQSDFSKTQL